MGEVSKDGIADIVVMRALAVSHEDGVFEFGAISDDGLISDDDRSPDISARSDLNVVANDGWTDDCGCLSDRCVLTDKDIRLDLVESWHAFLD